MRSVRIQYVLLAAAACALGFGPSDARPAVRGTPVTLSMLANLIHLPALSVLIPNFERVYPNISVNVTYASTAVREQMTTTELAAGTAPDLIMAWPGCGNPLSVCLLAKEGYLFPMISVPWARFSARPVISASKYGPGLFVYSPTVSMWGVFTNDTLFAKLGLKVPQTFA